MKIENDIIELRAVELDDLDFVYRVENDNERSDASLNTAPISRFTLELYIRENTADIYADKQLRLIIMDKASAERIGVIDLCDFDARSRHAFIGIYICADYRCKGYGKAAIKLLCNYAWQHLGIHGIAALVSSENIASAKLFDKCGFKPCGNLRSWIRSGNSYLDARIYQILFA